MGKPIFFIVSVAPSLRIQKINYEKSHSVRVESENSMQRTVKGVRVNLAKMEIVEGQITIKDSKSVVFPNTTEEKAVKKATKANLGYGVISTEPFEQLYVLDDEIFFKYATPVENTAEVKG